jgi:hypothetical protein
MPTNISDTVTGDGLKTSILGDCVKKCQQTFLASLSGMDLKRPFLVIMLRNANKKVAQMGKWDRKKEGKVLLG